MSDDKYLSDFLSLPENAGLLVKVTFELYADTYGDKRVYILTPKPMQSLYLQTKIYAVAVRTGHTLNREVRNNRAIITQLYPAKKAQWVKVAFVMLCDGTPFDTDDGTARYIFSLCGDGEVVRVGASEETSAGTLARVHFGRRPEDDSDYPDSHRFISSTFRNVDMNILNLPELNAAEGGKRSKFS